MRLGNTGLSKRQRELERGSLGDTDETVETVTTILDTASNLLPSILGGGSGCSALDKRSKRELAQTIDQHLTASDKRNLVAIANASISPTGASMADFIVGGHDCKHKNVHPDDQEFLNEVDRLIQQRISGKAGPPASASISTKAAFNPWINYAIIGLGIAGAGAGGYYAYQNWIK